MTHDTFEEVIALGESPGVVNLATCGFTPDRLLPNWRRILSHLASDCAGQYPPSRGLSNAIDAVGVFYRSQGVQAIKSYNIAITSGATDAIFICLRTLTKPGQTVVLLEPFYPQYGQLLERLGLRASVMRLSPPEWRITSSQLRSAMRPNAKAVIVTNPHNPTGRVFDNDEMATVMKTCNDHGASLIVDEAYACLAHKRLAFKSILTCNCSGVRCFSIGSLSKNLALPGLRAGWLASNASVDDIVATILDTKIGINVQSQCSIERLLPFATPIASALAKELTLRRRAATMALKAIGVNFYRSEGTYYITASIPAHLEDGRNLWRAILDEAGVLVMPLNDFYASSAPNHLGSLVRLSYACEPKVWTEGVRRIGVWLKSRRHLA